MYYLVEGCVIWNLYQFVHLLPRELQEKIYKLAQIGIWGGGKHSVRGQSIQCTGGDLSYNQRLDSQIYVRRDLGMDVVTR